MQTSKTASRLRGTIQPYLETLNGILRGKLALSALFGFAEVIIDKLFTTLMFIVVVRALPREEIGILSVAQSWVMVLLFLQIMPVRSLIRDHMKFQARLREHISAYLLFWVFQALVLSSVAAALAATVAWAHDDRVLGIAILVMFLQFQFIALSVTGKVAFFVNYQQRYVTLGSFLLGIINLASIALLLQHPTLYRYLLLLMGLNLLAALFWIYSLARRLKISLTPPKDSLAILRQGLLSYGIWNHMQTILFDLILLVDPLVLWFFASYSEIGDYGIAQRVNSLLFILPGVLTNNLELGTAALHNPEREKPFTRKFLLASTAIAVGQFLFLLLFGRLMLRYLFNVDASGPVFTYLMVMSCGVMVLNIVRPLIGRLNARANLRTVTWQVSVPAALASVFFYVLTAALWGPMGAAFGNILAYGTLAALIVRAVRRFAPFPRLAGQ